MQSPNANDQGELGIAAMSDSAAPRKSMRFCGRSCLAFVLTPESPIFKWLANLDEWSSRFAGYSGGKPAVLDVSALKLSNAAILHVPTRSKRMFGKKDLVDNLSRDLDRARDKRDALTFKRDAIASDVTTLTTQIAELETRLAEEKDRRERERAADEIEGIQRRLKDTARAFAPVIAGLCDATEAAAAVVPEARELNSFLLSVATEVDIVVESLLRELQRRAEAVSAGHAALELPQSVNEAPQPPKNDDRLLVLPAGLPRDEEAEKKESAGDRLSTAA
jgi:hypothetical protein